MTKSGAKGSIRWKSRVSYGRMLHKIIKKLSDGFDKEQDMDKCINYARTIVYAINVGKELINDEQNEEFDRRLTSLEKDTECRMKEDSRNKVFDSIKKCGT